MPAVAHTAQGFAQQELDRIEATLATLQTWASLVRNCSFNWDNAKKLRAVADRLEAAEDFWNDRNEEADR
jgi:hypothetical protein